MEKGGAISVQRSAFSVQEKPELKKKRQNAFSLYFFSLSFALSER